jgi:hypothetical protein
MKNFLLLLVIIIAAVYAYHWYTGQHAEAPATDATPAPEQRQATQTPQRKALETSGLQTHSLNRGGAATPDAKATPLNAPHR